jgi:TrmH family RNA methyltransferase
LTLQPSRFARRKPQDPITRRDESLAFEEAWRPPEWFGQISVVLVETTDPVNIGGVVRAMANTGFLGLRLVSPVDFDPWHVVGVAHYTQHILEATHRYDSLPEAVADQQLVLGLTGRHHRVERNALPFQAAMDRITDAAMAGERVSLVFGREDYGMSNTMLDACHAVATIPTNPAYPSLNLAQAVLLVLYQLFQRSGGEDQPFRPPRRKAPAATSKQLEEMFSDVECALETIEFFKGRSRTSALRSLRVAFFRAGLDASQAALLRAVFIEVRKFVRRLRSPENDRNANPPGAA